MPGKIIGLRLLITGIWRLPHFDPDFVPRAVPWLSGAYEAMKYIYEELKFSAPGYPKTLADYEKQYRPTARKLIQIAMNATLEIRDDF